MLHLRDGELSGIAERMSSLNRYHVAITLNLDLLARRETPEEKVAELAAESLQLVRRCAAETHRLAELLRPQALDPFGFAAVAERYARRFTQTTGIEVRLTLPAVAAHRLPAAVEMALFRVLEEGLSNVYRHSRTAKVDVTLQQRSDHVVLTIRDYGAGMSATATGQFRRPSPGASLGLMGLRERILELGGELTVKAQKPGTLLRVRVPISRASAEPPGT